MKIFLLTLFASSLWAQTAAEVPLKVWQIKYSAETDWMDDYVIEGSATQLTGKFALDGERLQYVEAQVPVNALSSGVRTRDRNISEIIFQKADGTTPDLAFRAGPTDCVKQSEGLTCAINGEFSIQGEWKPLSMDLIINPWEDAVWMHGEVTLKLSDYDFYENGDEDLKMADEVQLTIDLLDDN